MDGMIGRELGPYRVVEQIGVGGMATVYKAYHAVMDRYVAVKVMPEQMSQDEDFRRRFEREAKAVARLEHAHILPVYDYGEVEGRLYLVMRYIDAGTLKDRMAAGPLDLAEVSRFIRQVGRALEYAHGMGVVHRDVKPSNVLVDAQGDCYLTDFGLAKMLEASVQLTASGVGVGTPAYMSPEQGQGEKVDARSDIYSLGVMLYEMVTGQVPYEAETPLAVVLKHITAPLPLPREVRPDVPEEVERVILRALAKNPGDRFQAMGEMMAVLDVAVSGAAVEEVEATRIAVAPPPVMPSPEVERVPAPPSAEPTPVPVWPGLPWNWVAGIGAAVVAVVGLVIALARESGPSTPTPEPPMDTPVAQATTPALTVVPTATPMLPTDTLVPATPVPPTDTPTSRPPTDMPMLPTDTPSPVPPTNTPTPTKELGPYYGRLAFTSNRDGKPEIYVVNLSGGSPTRLTNNDVNDWLPDWSPDGTKIAFTSNRRGGYDLWTMNGDGSGQTAVVTTDAWDDYPRWAPDGQPLSLSTTAITQDVANSEIFIRLTDGSLVQRTSSTAEDQWADWSPDGRIIYTEGFKGTSNWDIYVVNADGSNRTVWLGGATCDVQATWSPDGHWIAFVRIPSDNNGNGQIDEGDPGDIWVGRASGGGLRQLTSGVWVTTPSWSPGSQWVAFARVHDSNGNRRSDGEDASDIWAIPVGGGEAVPLVESPYRDVDPSWTW